MTTTDLALALGIQPSLFDPASISAETLEQNKAIVERLSAAPDMWTYEPQVIREARLNGRGPFPICEADAFAETHVIEGPDGMIPMRIYRPSTGVANGYYLHLHGGGWVLGSARENDARLRELTEATGLTSVSVDYRLAPEHPWPAGPDDCEAAALWLLGDMAKEDARSFLAIGGESAGAHLAVVTLLRLRDKHGLTPFDAANLTAGCFDMAGTESVRTWGTEKLILNTRDVDMFFKLLLPEGSDRADPDISPVHADLHALPPALFSCGTRDLLIDDTLILARRWRDAGNGIETGIWPGGCHVFQNFDTAQSRQSRAQIHDFLKRRMAAKHAAG